MKEKILITKNRIALVGAVVSLWSGAVRATPTLYPTDITLISQIKNQTNSNIMMDDVDPKKVYVMPPKTASAKVTGLHTINANVGFCQEMSMAQTYSRSLLERMDRLIQQEVDQKPEVDKFQKALFDARAKLAGFATSKDLSALTDIDNSIETTDLRLKDLYAHIDKCSANCEPAIEEAQNLQSEKIKLVKLRREIAKQKVADVRQYERFKQAVQNAQDNFDEKSAEYEKIRNRVSKLRADFFQIYSNFGKMEGARASFTYLGNWNENVVTLRADNPGFAFEQIQATNATVYSSLLNIKNLPAGGAILAYELPGKQVEGGIELPSYPPSLSGNVVLSLLGTCPMLHPEDYKLDTPTGVKEMKYGMTVTYYFPSTFKLQVTARYNMYKMYQKIVSSGNSGGFFTSRSWSNVEERNFFRDSFSVNWVEQDPSNSVSEEERLSIESELRKEIFSRLATLALANTPNRDGIIAAAAPSAHGAVVLADSLTKTCPANVYCAGGAIVLNVLDAIFGSGSSSASYTNIQDIEIPETWSRDKVTLKPWITTYNP